MGKANMMKLSDYLSLAGLELHAERAKALEAEVERLDKVEQESDRWKEAATRHLEQKAKAEARVELLQEWIVGAPHSSGCFVATHECICGLEELEASIAALQGGERS